MLMIKSIENKGEKSKKLRRRSFSAVYQINLETCKLRDSFHKQHKQRNLIEPNIRC